MRTTPAVQATPRLRCYGQQDAHQAPICDGPDVRHVRVDVVDGSPFTTNWCADCRADATADGMMVVSDVTPVSEYAARLARVTALLGDPKARCILEPMREAIALDSEAEVADMMVCPRCHHMQPENVRCINCGRHND
jgi:hypothetical protein